MSYKDNFSHTLTHIYIYIYMNIFLLSFRHQALASSLCNIYDLHFPFLILICGFGVIEKHGESPCFYRIKGKTGLLGTRIVHLGKFE
ncbi:unnamed protein product [Phytomonas sp. EM1]|nr:unnamed protein product [Phytomonas sp. EM1]|eukprot:CCW61563.1 unnamed protein product [Phytomonas sp. isolate EM1]